MTEEERYQRHLKAQKKYYYSGARKKIATNLTKEEYNLLMEKLDGKPINSWLHDLVIKELGK